MVLVLLSASVERFSVSRIRNSSVVIGTLHAAHCTLQTTQQQSLITVLLTRTHSLEALLFVLDRDRCAKAVKIN